MDISLDIVDNFKKVYAEPVFMKDFAESGQITCLELSQYEWSQDVVLLGFVNKIILGYLRFKDVVMMDIISEFPIPYRCTCLSISPQTSISTVPSTIVFCSAGTDFKIRVIRSDLVDDCVCTVLSGHSSYINDVKFDYEHKYLASVSDDNTLKLWETENYKCLFSLQLDFPGIAVQWHKEDASKLLVADKVGIIRLYNTETLKPVQSLDAGKTLHACHWCPSNSQQISSLQLGELSVWDLSVPSSPRYSGLIFTEAGGFLKFSPQGDLIAALNPLEGSLKVFKVDLEDIQFSTSIKLPTNFCWHYRYPIILVGSDDKFCIWKINTA